MSNTLPTTRRERKERSFLIAIALFVMICGAMLVALPTTSTAPEEERACVEDGSARRALRAVLEASLALDANNEGQARLQLQNARQALSDALDQ